MKLTDEVFIAAPREDVYAALNDVEVLKDCIPGCEELVRHSDTELKAKVLLKVGPVKARFSGTVTLIPEEPPRRFTLTGSGSGGTAGFAKGGADVVLRISAASSRNWAVDSSKVPRRSCRPDFSRLSPYG